VSLNDYIYVHTQDFFYYVRCNPTKEDDSQWQQVASIPLNDLKGSGGEWYIYCSRSNRGFIAKVTLQDLHRSSLSSVPSTSCGTTILLQNNNTATTISWSSKIPDATTPAAWQLSQSLPEELFQSPASDHLNRAIAAETFNNRYLPQNRLMDYGVWAMICSFPVNEPLDTITLTTIHWSSASSSSVR
jgi:hypothetical protein